VRKKAQRQRERERERERERGERERRRRRRPGVVSIDFGEDRTLLGLVKLRRLLLSQFIHRLSLSLSRPFLNGFLTRKIFKLSSRINNESLTTKALKIRIIIDRVYLYVNFSALEFQRFGYIAYVQITL
jgi:hypothetical protein